MMGEVIMSGIVPQLTKPVGAIRLSDLAEGSIVKINESGLPVEFYVAKHNYESSLNGAGRTLLVRKDIHSTQKWVGTVYGSSNLDTWFNSTYKVLLDAVMQSAIGTTKFYNIPNNSTNTVSTLSRSVFALSTDELGSTIFNRAAEGSALPIASILAIAYFNGAASTQWTRSVVRNEGAAYAFYTGGNCVGAGVGTAFGARPCFTLPATAQFDEKTLLFKGVS